MVKIVIEKEWTNINNLVATDINGGVVALGLAAGDTLNINQVSSSYIRYWQGATPTASADDSAGSVINAGKQAIIGVSGNVFLKKETDADVYINAEVVKGA